VLPELMRLRKGVGLYLAFAYQFVTLSQKRILGMHLAQLLLPSLPQPLLLPPPCSVCICALLATPLTSHSCSSYCEGISLAEKDKENTPVTSEGPLASKTEKGLPGACSQDVFLIECHLDLYRRTCPCWLLQAGWPGGCNFYHSANGGNSGFIVR
jgi:hypothetical protein